MEDHPEEPESLSSDVSQTPVPSSTEPMPSSIDKKEDDPKEQKSLKSSGSQSPLLGSPEHKPSTSNKKNNDPEVSSSSNSSGSHSPPLLCSSEYRVILIGGHNLWEWAFLSLCIPNVIVLLTSYGLSVHNCFVEDCLHSDVCIFGTESCCITCVFEIEMCIICGMSLIFALYGVFGEHQYDIYLHCILVFLATTFSFICWAAEKDSLGSHTTKLALNCCSAVLWLACSMLCWRATTVPDWLEFRIIGVSDPLAAMYRQVCYFLAVLKFDSVFLVFAGISALYIRFKAHDMVFISVGVMIVLYSALSWACGKAVIQKEDMYLSFGFIVFTLAYPVFVVYQCYELINTVKRAEALLYYSAFVLGLVVILTKIYLVVQMKKTWQTFGYGLIDRSFQDLVTGASSNFLVRSRSALVH